MKNYFCEVGLDSGYLHVEVTAADDATENEVFDAALREIESQICYAKLREWGSA